jgi:16S rRNA (guanine527-N7)-methyltransferase
MEGVTPVSDDEAVAGRLAELATQYGLPERSAPRLRLLLDLVQQSHHSLTAVRDPSAGVEVHIADSLAGLEVDAIRAAGRIADLGSGAGFPGLVLAIARPDARVVLVESVGKKAGFLEEAAERLELGNVEVVGDRAEAWAAGRETCGVVPARALARLDVLLEYAAPLLRVDGVLVAWKGKRDKGEETGAWKAGKALGMEAPVPMTVPGPGGSERQLYLSQKLRPTPPEYPRRAGMAAKRPLGGSSRT